MHQCLQVSEIQFEIFAHLESHKGTLAALASTCRSFNEPATDILWKEVHLRSLVETIEENEEFHHVSTSSSVPSKSQLIRFLFLASKVECLTVDHDPVDKLDSLANAVERLQLIFPHLTKTRLSFSEPLDIDLLKSCFLHPNLTEMDIVDISTKNAMEFLEFLPQCTALSSLHTLGMGFDYKAGRGSYLDKAGRPFVMDSFLQILLARGLGALREVRLDVFNGRPALMYDLLEVSSSLRPIHLCIDFRSSREPEGCDGPSDIDFRPKLSSTVLHKGFKLTSLWECISLAIKQMGITTEKLTLCGHERWLRSMYRGSTHQDLIDIISSIPRLSSLTTLGITEYDQGLLDWIPDPDGFANESKTLMGGLLLLTRLECLDIEIPFILVLDDSWLAEASVAWLNLTRLNLTYGSRTITPQFTLEGTLPLLESCRRLQELSISLICQPFDTTLISTAVKDNQVRSVVFPYSTLENWKNVYECLEMMLSSATYIYGCCPSDMYHGEFGDDWPQLNKKLEVLGLSRTWK